VAVVIQNSKESKMIYGADVSGTVFKEISDRIYSRYTGAGKYTTVNKTDSFQYNYFGLKNELNSIFNSLNMPFIDSARSGYWRSLQLKNNSGILNTPVISTSTSDMVTPDVVGLGLKDAVYLLENKGLKVMATGRGRVVNQSLAAGTNFNKTQTISLILN
jgi:cell division protein FtsI (penicillin-binding protein 3)